MTKHKTDFFYIDQFDFGRLKQKFDIKAFEIYVRIQK